MCSVQIILSRWIRGEVKVILVRYDSELTLAAEANQLKTVLPYFDGEPHVFCHENTGTGELDLHW